MISLGHYAAISSMVLLALVAAGVSGCASVGAGDPAPSPRIDSVGEENKRVVREMVRVVWTDRDLDGLKAYWSEDCVNHADQGPSNTGQGPLRAYHQGFLTGFLPAFSDQRIEFVQQISEGDLVVSQMRFHGQHTGEIFGVQPTGRTVVLSSIRIDRVKGGKITEHWSVADVAGFKQQLQ